MTVNTGRKIDGKYTIFERLGRGSFGEVYRVVDPEGNQFAAKFEHISISGSRQGSEQSPEEPWSYIKHEHTVMQFLYENRIGNVQTPRVYECTRHGNYNVIIMDIFGETLSKLKRDRGEKFSTKTLLMIMKQCLRRLEYVHKCGFVHRDVKHNNIVIGRYWNQRHTMYLIDYGLSYRWSEQKQRAAPDGSRAFSSINGNQGYTTNRADDIESLLYNMVYLETGLLPWAASRDRRQIAINKLQITNAELFQGMPLCFGRIREHIKTLPYEAEPHYELYHSWIDTELTSRGFQDDGEYDWMSNALWDSGVIA